MNLIIFSCLVSALRVFRLGLGLAQGRAKVQVVRFGMLRNIIVCDSGELLAWSVASIWFAELFRDKSEFPVDAFLETFDKELWMLIGRHRGNDLLFASGSESDSCCFMCSRIHN